MNELSSEEWDYIIVGAGIVGVVTAKYLKEEQPKSKILLVDKYLTSGQGNTAKSNACYRDVFDTDLNIILSTSSIQYYKHLENDKKIDIGLKEFGYLWLLSEEQYQSRCEKTIDYSREGKTKKISLIEFLDLNNIKFTIYSLEELKIMLPALKTDFTNSKEIYIKTENIAYGLLGKQCGSLEPDLLVRSYESTYKELGGKCKYNSEVLEILLKEKGQTFDPDYIHTVWRESEIGGIKIRNIDDNSISIIQSKNVIITTGAWINQLLDPLGINSTIKAKKRQLFRICGLNDLISNKHFSQKIKSIPFTILPIAGIFIKPIPDAGCVDVGCSDDIGRRFESRIPLGIKEDTFENKLLDNPIGEIDFYLTNILPILKTYFPSIFSEELKIEKPSAGMYAYSTDKFPVIEQVTKLGNLFFCSGTSGSGIMKADSIGRIFVSLILNRSQSVLYGGHKIDVSDFSIHSRNLPKENLVL